jgi:hypothetical protein
MLRHRGHRGESKPGRPLEKRGPDSDAETLAFFAEYVGQHSQTREDIKTWFEAAELDDYASFGGKP